MAIDLKSLNHAQLSDLITKAKARQAEAAREHLAELRARVEQLVKKEGFTLADVFPARAKKRIVAKRPAQYRNPADASQTWGGHGKRPNWFKAALQSGKKEADLLAK